MIPILFDSTETAFNSNGLGRLTEADSCKVTESDDLVYTLELTYPVTGKLYEQLQLGRYIFATHDNNGDPQPFQIYQITEPVAGLATIRAWHIGYMLTGIVVRPFTAGSCAEAMAKLSTESLNSNPFTFWTDKTVTGPFELKEPRNLRSILAGEKGSILDVYGKGDYKFDMFTVRLYLNRGADRGVEIRYGKNLASLDRQIDASGVYVSAVPYWSDSEGNTVYYNGVVTRTGSAPGRAIVMDLSEDFEEQPTESQLQARCQQRLDSSDAYEVRDNIKIDFVQLWQTEEYKAVANLERVSLCDTVHVIYKGIRASAKCIKVVYDTLLERYTEMELGAPRRTYSEEIKESIVAPAIAKVPDRASIQSQIDKATELIAGGFGGYIKFNYLSNGTPSEMLIMDSQTESAAVHIIRLNKNGIGFSTDGGATYRNAWTIDGNLNADFITTGQLLANIITAGILTDATGDNYWNLDSGVFNTQQGKIGDFTLSNGVLTYGDDTDDTTPYMELSPTRLVYKPAGWNARMIIDGQRLTFESYDYDATPPAWRVDAELSVGFNPDPADSSIEYPGLGLHLYDPTLANMLFPYEFNSNEVYAAEAPVGETYYYAHRAPSTYISGTLGAGGAVLYDPLGIKSGGTGARTGPEALNNLGQKHLFIAQQLSSSEPLTIQVGETSTYWSALILGLAQGSGAVIIGLRYNNGTLTARNLANNTAWNNSALSFSASGNTLTIRSSYTATSNITILAG